MNRDALLLELAGFLAYEAAHDDAECFGDWILTTSHSWSERSYLEAAYMVAIETPRGGLRA